MSVVRRQSVVATELTTNLPTIASGRGIGGRSAVQPNIGNCSGCAIACGHFFRFELGAVRSAVQSTNRSSAYLGGVSSKWSGVSRESSAPAISRWPRLALARIGGMGGCRGRHAPDGRINLEGYFNVSRETRASAGRCRSTSSTSPWRSLGVRPGIRLAWPSDWGRTASSFSRASNESAASTR